MEGIVVMFVQVDLGDVGLLWTLPEGLVSALNLERSGRRFRFGSVADAEFWLLEAVCWCIEGVRCCYGAGDVRQVVVWRRRKRMFERLLSNVVEVGFEFGE